MWETDHNPVCHKISDGDKCCGESNSWIRVQNDGGRAVVVGDQRVTSGRGDISAGPEEEEGIIDEGCGGFCGPSLPSLRVH